MSSTDGGANPWDLEQYRPGVRRTARAPRSTVPGQEWDDSEGEGRRIRARYENDGAPLLLLAAWTALLTVLTLGLYRFWMVTRLRRYYWRAIRIDGDPLEYTGRGIEKFMGFLLAVILLAIYLGLVNLALTFLGLALGSEIALQFSIFSAMPLFYFAAYRARRYVLARTRWRGIRFGMDSGAWAFAARGLWYTGLTVLSAGLLYPLMHFRLEKFMVDRSWFGDVKFEQNGSWLGIFANWFWIYAIVALMGLAAWGMIDMPDDPASIVIASVTFAGGGIAILILMLFYQVAAFRYLWENRSLGSTEFENDISSGSVLGIYIGGTLLSFVLSFLITVVVLLGIAFLLDGILEPGERVTLSTDILAGNIPPNLLTKWYAYLALILAYLSFVMAWFAFSQVFLTQPILRRMAEGMTIVNPGHLMHSRQRAHDPALEAGGFADALGVDVGAGF